MPCINTNDLFAFTEFNNQSKQVKTVPVRRILGGNGNSWDLTDRGPTYVFELAKAIAQGHVYLDKMEPPILYEVNGLLGIMTDGTHRVAALKGIDDQNAVIKAEVSQIVTPFSVVLAFSLQDHAEILRRQSNGLWEGSIQGGSSESSWPNYYAQGHIDRCDGPWVFARDMEHAKQLYLSVNG